SAAIPFQFLPSRFAFGKSIGEGAGRNGAKRGCLPLALRLSASRQARQKSGLAQGALAVERAMDESGLSRSGESVTSFIVSEIRVRDAFGPVRDTRAGASFGDDCG